MVDATSSSDPGRELASLGHVGVPAAMLEASVPARFEGDRVRFAHPLLAAGAYERLPPGRRRALHSRLAHIVPDSDQRARHLALGADGPDPRLADLLEGAATRAHLRGAPEAAADLAERALRLDDSSG